MLDLLWDVAAWLFGALAAAVDWLFASLSDALLVVWTYVVAMFVDGWDALRETLQPWISQHFPQFDAIPWSQISGFLGDVGWIIPTREVVVIVVGALVASASIRLVRWAIGLIPTING